MVNNGARDLLFFFNIPYLTILNTLEVSENTFSHQNITFYAFFSIRPPTRGSFYVKILFMITWLIMELETYFFFLYTIFDHFKHTGSVRKHIFSSEHYFLCLFFHTTSHQGELFQFFSGTFPTKYEGQSRVVVQHVEYSRFK